MLSSRGRFYTTSGAYLLELDIEKRVWTACVKPVDVPLYLSFTEGRDGTIYAGSYEGCHLVAFDPGNPPGGGPRGHGSRKRCISRVWRPTIRAGSTAGSAWPAIISSPSTRRPRERRQLVAESERQTGSCAVSSGADGKAYGNIDGQDYILYDGAKTPLPEGQPVPPECTGAVGWGSILNRLPDGRQVSAYSLDGKWFEVTEPTTGATRRVAIDYQSEGAYVRFVFPGPGGKVWGASGHPPWTFTFDPKTGKTAILGRARSWQAADSLGGNIIARSTRGAG